MTTATARTIRALGQEHGVQSSYVDVEGIRHVASVEVVAAVLRALGAIDAPADAPEALRRCRAATRARVLGPVAVAWDGVVDLALALPEPDEPEAVDVVVEHEDGRVSERAVPVTAVPRRGTREHRCRLPDRLPSGVHTVHVHAGSVEASTTVVAAPTRCFEDRSRGRGFGVSAPTYALRHPPDFGAGNLRGLEDLGNWVADLGGSYLATLPLLPVYLGNPFEPSPYLPVTRRHWNEALLGPGDLDRAAPLAADRRAPRAAPTREMT